MRENETICPFWRFFPSFTVAFALKLAIFPLKCSVWESQKAISALEKGQRVPRPQNQCEMPIKQGENATETTAGLFTGIGLKWDKKEITKNGEKKKTPKDDDALR